MQNNTCTIEGCETKHKARGLCKNHYNEWYRINRPRKSRSKPEVAARKLATKEQLFLTKAIKSEGCWGWSGTLSPTGYTTLNAERKKWFGHRVSFEMHIGPIPDGFDIDHKCHNKSCTNPDHLQAVSRKENKENTNGAYKCNSTGIRGVTWTKNRKKYKAQITHNSKTFYLGCYESIAEAEAVVLEARNRLFTNNLLDRVA